MCYICVGFNFHLIFDIVTSPPPRQVFRSGQPSTDVGVGAYLKQKHYVRDSEYIRFNALMSRWVLALPTESWSVFFVYE